MFITLFSILKWSFKDQQDNSLQDYVECSLMLQYNKQKKNIENNRDTSQHNWT